MPNLAVLTTLNLSDNRSITNYGRDMSAIIALADALKVNAVLKKCDLRYNNMGDEAKAALQEVVKSKEGFELLL